MDSVSQCHKSIWKSLDTFVWYVDTKVLQNISLSSTTTSLPITDDKDMDIRGHGLFLLSSNALEASDNPASILLQSFCEVGEVVMQNENTITCDKILNATSYKSEFLGHCWHERCWFEIRWTCFYVQIAIWILGLRKVKMRKRLTVIYIKYFSRIINSNIKFFLP